jgi:hypothetical protein
MWLGESWRGFSRTQRLRRRDLDWEDRGPYGELERDETDQSRGTRKTGGDILKRLGSANVFASSHLTQSLYRRRSCFPQPPGSPTPLRGLG